MKVFLGRVEYAKYSPVDTVVDVYGSYVSVTRESK
jgi:hypothetical protein